MKIAIIASIKISIYGMLFILIYLYGSTHSFLVLYFFLTDNDSLIWQIKKNSNNNNLKFIINAQYLKDLSFENPRAPESLKNFSSNPTFKIDVDVKSRTLSDHGQNIYEVELLIKGETKVQNDSLFVIEGSLLWNFYYRKR